MDADERIRLLRKALADKQRVAMERLKSAAAKSADAEVRAAWAESKTLEDIAAEFSRKREDE